MIAAEVMVPCMSTTASCRLDWVAIAALGGWAAAIATFFAVLLPFRNYQKELKLRRLSEDVEAQIAIRGSIVTMTNIYAGLGAIAARIDMAQGIDDFTESLSLVRTYFTPHPLPTLPSAPDLADLRMALSSLDAALKTMSGYLTTQEMGVFDGGTAKEYMTTLALTQHYFSEVVSHLDRVMGNDSFGSVFVPFK